jgi:hypothetical protein
MKGKAIMPKIKKIIFILVSVFILSSGGMGPLTPAQAQTTKLFNVFAILPGQTQTIDAIQAAVFPLGCQQFFVGILGAGTLGVSLLKSDRAGDPIFMVGIVSSSAGTVPIARGGVSNGMLSQIITIGEGGGFVWVWSGVAFSAAVAPYSYQIRFSLAP